MTASRVGYVYDSGLADYIPFTGPPAALPAGMLTMTATNTAPSGWMLCNGSAVSRTTYADLFTAIGTTYGVGDGSTTFNIPDFRGRVAVGADSSQTEFDALGETGGSKTSVASHTHGIDHDHPSFTSGTDDTDHGHAGWSGGINANHVHTTNTAGDAGSFLSGSTNNYRYTDTGSPSLNTGTVSSDHAHYTTVGGRSALHGHPIDVPAFTGNSASQGVTSGNLQPYITINYIIKH
jgi:microcystin-dependent protein